MISAADRKSAIELIDEANENGARIELACRELNISARTYYRWKNSKEDKRPLTKRPSPKNKLTKEEKQKILKVVNQPKYKDLPPSQIVPSLADEGVYIASESTFYRVMKEAKLNTKRTGVKTHNVKTIDTHIAVSPNEVWSWDITWLPGPIKGGYYKLYLILDIYSRMIVGWEVYEEESSSNAESLVKKAVFKHGILNRPLVLHSDNGSPMRAQSFQALLEKLGITKSYSRPRVSNDNPFSEALFRTLKYNKDFPVKGFESIEQARSWVFEFVNFYNKGSLHSGIKYVTPYDRHYGLDDEILKNRKEVYREAKAKNPSRWSRNIRNWDKIKKVSLNPTDDLDKKENLKKKVL